MDAEPGHAQARGVEDQLAAAAASGDDNAYFTALRSARFVVPVNMTGGQSRLLLLDMDGQRHTAAFTSAQLASQAVAQYAGATPGWLTPDFSTDELVKTFSEPDPRLLLNPGTPAQKAFTVSELVERWKASGHEVTVPRKRRGSIKAGLAMLAFAVLALLMWNGTASDTVMCGSQVMAPDDTCIVSTSGNSVEQSFEETRSSQQRSSTIALAVGIGLGIGAIYMLVARIVTAVPRRA
jgi:hypothetical protein